MPKRATGPRYHECRGGWYCQINGKRILLAKGEKDDSNAEANALLKYWEVAGTDLRSIVRKVDWVRLRAARKRIVPDHLMKESDWGVMLPMLMEMTNAEIPGWLEAMDITKEMLAMFFKEPEPKKKAAPMEHWSSSDD